MILHAPAFPLDKSSLLFKMNIVRLRRESGWIPLLHPKEIILDASKSSFGEEGIKFDQYSAQLLLPVGVSGGLDLQLFDSKSELVGRHGRKYLERNFPIPVDRLYAAPSWNISVAVWKSQKGYQKYPGFLRCIRWTFSQGEKRQEVSSWCKIPGGILQNMLFVLQRDAPGKTRCL